MGGNIQGGVPITRERRPRGSTPSMTSAACAGRCHSACTTSCTWSMAAGWTNDGGCLTTPPLALHLYYMSLCRTGARRGCAALHHDPLAFPPGLPRKKACPLELPCYSLPSLASHCQALLCTDRLRNALLIPAEPCQALLSTAKLGCALLSPARKPQRPDEVTVNPRGNDK